MKLLKYIFLTNGGNNYAEKNNCNFSNHINNYVVNSLQDRNNVRRNRQPKNIAFEIKNSEDYKLPEGYEVSYPDSTKTNKIAISIKASKGSGDNVIAIFDMTKAEPELVSYQQDTLGIIIETVFIVILIITVILAAGAFLI